MPKIHKPRSIVIVHPDDFGRIYELEAIVEAAKNMIMEAEKRQQLILTKYSAYDPKDRKSIDIRTWNTDPQT